MSGICSIDSLASRRPPIARPFPEPRCPPSAETTWSDATTRRESASASEEGDDMIESQNVGRQFFPSGSPSSERLESDASAILWRFSDAVDKRLADAAARLFARDGVFRRAGEVICGRANIESFYWSRLAEPGRVTRHVWSNVRCESS